MSKRKRKNRKQKTDPNKVLILLTVLIQLISAIVNLIAKLLE